MFNLVAGCGFSTLVDEGVANFLGLETLRHGTNPINALGIKLFGGDPSHGCKKSGSAKNWSDDNTDSYFYLFKDSEIGNTSPELSTITKTIVRFLLPQAHKIFSGYNLIDFQISDDNSNLINRIKSVFNVFLGTIFGLVSLIISPTLKFRFSHIDPSRFENDPRYMGAAYKTNQKVESWRLGFIGSLITGVNSDWFSRVKANPGKFLTGVVQLTAAVGVATLLAPSLLASPYLLAASVMLA